MRSITFEQAKARYVHRYTCEHIPTWAKKPHYSEATKEFIGFYMPQYLTDLEWYNNSIFPGEKYLSKRESHCESSNQSWPRGKGFSGKPIFTCQTF